jgi:hypothetical protein
MEGLVTRMIAARIELVAVLVAVAAIAAPAWADDQHVIVQIGDQKRTGLLHLPATGVARVLGRSPA